MATKTMLSVDEYLDAGFENPEPDYVDGVVMERAMPTDSHSRVSRNIYRSLLKWDDDGSLVARWEIRLRGAPTRFRVADMAFFTSKPTTEVPEDQPFIVVEILSPDDRLNAVHEKLQDYERIGVHYIFLANPMLRTLALYRDGSLISVSALEVPEFGIKVPLDRTFAE